MGGCIKLYFLKKFIKAYRCKGLTFLIDVWCCIECFAWKSTGIDQEVKDLLTIKTPQKLLVCHRHIACAERTLKIQQQQCSNDGVLVMIKGFSVPLLSSLAISNQSAAGT